MRFVEVDGVNGHNGGVDRCDRCTGATGATGAGSKGTQTIVVIGDLSGQQRPGTLFIVAAIKSSINYFNSHGGWGRRHPERRRVESNSDPTTAVSDLTKYVSTHSQKPILCWCGEEATESNALVPVSTSDGLLSMSFTNEDNKCGTEAQSACPTYFASDVPPDYQGKAIANYLHTRGVTKVGLLEESHLRAGTDPGHRARVDGPWYQVLQSVVPGFRSRPDL